MYEGIIMAVTHLQQSWYVPPSQKDMSSNQLGTSQYFHQESYKRVRSIPTYMRTCMILHSIDSAYSKASIPGFYLYGKNKIWANHSNQDSLQ